MCFFTVLSKVVRLEFDLRNLWHSPVTIACLTCFGWFDQWCTYWNLLVGLKCDLKSKIPVCLKRGPL